MNKWYENNIIDKSPVISSRIRLARNLKNYPFYRMLKDEDSKKIIDEVVGSIKNNRVAFGNDFTYIDLNTKNDIEKIAMLEKHEISLGLLKQSGNKGILLKTDETVGIMLNEEDHIRIQTIFPGKNIKEAWDIADKIDNLIEESVDYSFSEKYGYLTSCPSNSGTGLRASYMIHLPMLESTGKLPLILASIGKFGMTIRGIYGEGSESLGSIYQISNQITLGKTEEEIIQSLENLLDQIVQSELDILEKNIKQKPIYFEDQIYRAYGILLNCRKISMKEAINLLSTVRIGFLSGILKEEKPKKTIYNIMMNIEYGNLQNYVGKKLLENEIDEVRANYIRNILKENRR